MKDVKEVGVKLKTVAADAWMKKWRRKKNIYEGQERHNSYSGEVNDGLCYDKDLNGEPVWSLRW